jgi:predicted secreted protein
MTWISGLAIYFIIWWVTLFAVLPFGVRSQAEAGEFVQGTDPGAPVRSRLLVKLLANSAVACVVFAALWFATAKLGLGLDSFPSIYPQDR